jgi:hypothetical protein
VRLHDYNQWVLSSHESPCLARWNIERARSKLHCCKCSADWSLSRRDEYNKSSNLGGIGIHLNPSASNSFIEGAGATLSGWNYGIENNANSVVVTNVSADNNTTAGFLIERAAGVALTNFGAHGNGEYGVLLNGVLAGQVSGGAVNPPASAGIQNNGLAGIQVNPISKPFMTSLGIRVFGNCGTGNLGSGIVLDNNVQNSQISGNEVTDNAGGDLMDHNNNCGSDLWFGNSFGIGTPVTCIGQSVAISVCPNP